ncbi:MAG: hypothetical protein K5837_05075 [Candidatus Saccharibacteria bacterium]|nr:hypothetical protein [Candidatus Saccharibacteria bacterium]
MCSIAIIEDDTWRSWSARCTGWVARIRCNSIAESITDCTVSVRNLANDRSRATASPSWRSSSEYITERSDSGSGYRYSRRSDNCSICFFI